MLNVSRINCLAIPIKQKHHPETILSTQQAKLGKIVVKAISGEEYTQLAGLFVHFLRCKKGYIARYAPLFTP